MKAVLIMRGLPGSGKSTVARELAKAVPDSLIVSADDFFMGGPIDVKALGHAHAFCQKKFAEALRNGTELVIVDNTNTTKGEIRPYAEKALEFGYELNVMEVPCDVETSVARNVHNAPRATIEKMAHNLANSPLDPSWNVVVYTGAGS
jgi:tRNA uridine 5-carbamoylmethylation protein Kti12